MVQLRVLAGKQAGASWVARRFPVRIGRGSTCDLRSEDPGVWDDHARIEFDSAKGFSLATQPNALGAVNGQTVDRVLLRNGDVIDLGGLKLQFWLAETRQKPLALREALTWTGIVLVSLLQVYVVYWLIR